jgi:endonuclease/exonuclease/phosphatase family metal-dependent hydrolase
MQRGRGVDGRCDAARAITQLRQATDFDVLCLQEVSAGYTDLSGLNGADQFAQLRALLPEYEAVTGILTDIQPGMAPRQLFGNMLFSRYPVLQATRHILPWPLDAEVKSTQRGVIETTLQTSLGPLRVSTTHLEYFSVLQRTAQVERLRELHRENALHARRPHPGQAGDGPFCAIPRAVPALLAGDCNFLPGGPEYQRLLAPFDDDVAPYCDAWSLRYPGQPAPPTVCLHERNAAPWTFDYLFATAALGEYITQIRVLPEVMGSDHQPLLIELRARAC